jgi:hypothetical protein
MPWIDRHSGPIMFREDVAPSVRIAQALRRSSTEDQNVWMGHTGTNDQQWIRYDGDGVRVENMIDTALATATLFTLDSIPK